MEADPDFIIEPFKRKPDFRSDKGKNLETWGTGKQPDMDLRAKVKKTQR